MSGTKMDIVGVGSVIGNNAIGWVFNGRGRVVSGIDLGRNTVGGWTIEELRQISDNYEKGQYVIVAGNE